jgi:hypothetical protein
MERRRAKREQLREAESRDGELRLAVRLVVDELSEAEQMIREAATAERYWEADRQLPDAMWVKYRTILATYVPGPADWLGITPAFKELNRLNRVVEERRHRIDAGGEVPVEPGDDTYAAWYEVHRAIWGLEATIDMEDDVATWLTTMERLAQAHWVDEPLTSQ